MNARAASWGRVTVGTVALFAIVLAFLAGRVKTGGDPTQASAPAPVVTTTTQAPPPESDPEPEPAPLTTQQS